MFEESVEDALETLQDTSEEASRARARRTEAVPSAKEVEERNLDHCVFMSWCPHCVKGGAEACGHKGGKEEEGGAGDRHRLRVHAQ